MVLPFLLYFLLSCVRCHQQVSNELLISLKEQNIECLKTFSVNTIKETVMTVRSLMTGGID